MITDRNVSCPCGVTEISVPTANGPCNSNASLPSLSLTPECRSRSAAQTASGAASVSAEYSVLHIVFSSGC